MKRRWILALIAVNLVLLTLLAFLYPQFMVAPGPLIPMHANLETNCFACHAPMRGAVAEKCIVCHLVADIGLRTTAGAAVIRSSAIAPFHQGLISQDCMGCHTDHTRAALMPGSPSTFSHALLSAAIRENCASCHLAPKTAVHANATTQCTQCHSEGSWKAATFDHAQFFALDGVHNAPCATCHTTKDRKQVTCYGCHEHNEADIRARHLREGITDIANCASCHRGGRGEGGEGDGEGGDD